MIDLSNYRPASLVLCDNPHRVILHGKSITVPCGCCDPCQLRNINCKSFNLNQYVQRFKYGIFFTLTYSAEYVPQISYWHDDAGYAHVCPVGRFVDDCPYVPILLNYDLPHLFRSVSTSHYDIIGEAKLARVNLFFPPLHENLSLPYNSPFVGVLNYKDMYRFKKRLLSKITYLARIGKFTSNKYSFFYVGEYGTKFKRPHFHCLFLTDDSSLVENLSFFRDLCFNAWTFRPKSGRCSNGSKTQWLASYSTFTTEEETLNRPNFSYIDTQHTNTSNYISSYISSSQNVPFVLTLRPWNSKQVCSKSSSCSFRYSHDDVRFFLHQIFTYSSHRHISECSTLQFFSRTFTSLDKNGLPVTKIIPISDYCATSVFPKPYQTLSLSDTALFQIINGLLCLLQESSKNPKLLILSNSFPHLLRSYLSQFGNAFIVHWYNYFRVTFRSLALYFSLSSFGVLDYLHYSNLYHHHIRPLMLLGLFYTDIQDFMDNHFNTDYIISFYDIDNYTQLQLLKKSYNIQKTVNILPKIRKFVDEKLFLHYKKHIISNF